MLEANWEFNKKIDQEHEKMDRTVEPGHEEWQRVGSKPKDTHQNRGRLALLEKFSSTSGRTIEETLQFCTSKFAILSEVSDEDGNTSGIEILKKQIRELPRPSNMTGPSHVQKIGKLNKGKTGHNHDVGSDPSGKEHLRMHKGSGAWIDGNWRI